VAKTRYFYWIFGVETAGRLSPFKGETPKRLKNSRFRAGSDYTRHTMHKNPCFFRVSNDTFIAEIKRE